MYDGFIFIVFKVQHFVHSLTEMHSIRSGRMSSTVSEAARQQLYSYTVTAMGVTMTIRTGSKVI